MITKAIIKKLCTSEDNHFTVYVPLLRKANAEVSDGILQATMICIPGIDNTLKVNDVVYVSFEDNSYDKPIILGKLYISKEDKKDITTTLTTKSIEVTEENKLPLNTSVGGINIADLHTKLTSLMDNKYLDSESIIYTREGSDVTNVKEALDELPISLALSVTTEDRTLIIGQGDSEDN